MVKHYTVFAHTVAERRALPDDLCSNVSGLWTQHLMLPRAQMLTLMETHCLRPPMDDAMHMRCPNLQSAARPGMLQTVCANEALLLHPRAQVSLKAFQDPQW